MDGTKKTAEEIVEEIQDLRQTIADLKEEDKKLHLLSSITKQVVDPVITTDLNFRITYVNLAFQQLYGYPEDELMGQSPDIFNAEPDSEQIQKDIYETVLSGNSWRGEAANIRKDGSTFPCEFASFPLKDEQGNVFAYAGVQRDITERKQAENQLLEAKQQAETANIAKSQFLANMSHEIRTPMNVINGFADLLISENDPSEQRNNVHLIQKASKSLLRIIDEILDVSRIEAGKFEVNIKDCSLSKLLDGIEVMMQPLAKDKGLQFDISRSTSLPNIINTDCGRVRQCLINLIGNAIKFTREGHLYLKVSMEEKKDEPFIKFDVEDTGIGIPSDQHEFIFESFSQVDGSHTRQYGGTGLGLAITKQLSNLLGGDLSFTSEDGKGSVFSLVIPAGVDIGSSELLDNNKQSEGLTPKSAITDNILFSGKVLLAEDDEGCQILTRKTLQRYGLEVVVVGNGKDAVEKAQLEQFDIILMDMQMPYLNGFEATKKLREEGITTPIIALTAYAMQGDKEKCIKTGCDDYLSKPIANEELIRVLTKYASTEKGLSN